MEDQREDFLFVSVELSIDKATLFGLSEHFVGIDATTIIVNPNQDAAALMAGLHFDRSLGRFAQVEPLVRLLQPVVDRIAQHMNQRFG